jgi:hypothetical protein
MKTILILSHKEKQDLFMVVNGNVSKAYDVAETYKVKGYRLKSATTAKTCVYKGQECAIISEHLNYYWIVFEGKEIKVTSNEIDL